MTLIEELQKFIDTTKHSREYKRAMAVKMQIEGKSYKEIQKLLSCSQSFISKWKREFIEKGVEGLNLKHKGSKSYLSPEEEKEIIDWIGEQKWITRESLELYISIKYSQVFASRQSYYELLKKGGMSWKKSQKNNPKRNEELVQSKKEEISRKLSEWDEEIKEGKLTVFMLDECHLNWGNLVGYVWGKTNERIKIDIENEKERQTYYGALDYGSKEFLMQEYSAGNTENTIKFLEYLRKEREGQRIVIIWDGAKYHYSQEMKEYLEKINGGKEEKEWQITCIKLAPNAPEQNPVEDIWLQGKNWVRKFYKYCNSFLDVKYLFRFFIEGEIFSFEKIFEYDFFTQMI